LRGFYDDNSLNAPDALAEPSTGFEIHPGISLNFPMERTLFHASYDLTLNYYLDRPTSKLDQSHIFDTRLNHRFTERYDVNVENSFIYSDEPAVLAPGGTAVDTVVRRGDSSGLRNSALIDFSGKMTPVIGTVVGYKNNLRNYNQTGTNSYSALLDSVENLFHVDVQWFQSETTVYFAGYQFGLFNYTSSLSTLPEAPLRGRFLFTPTLKITSRIICMSEPSGSSVSNSRPQSAWGGNTPIITTPTIRA
jgi:hypothetical protein